MRIFSALVPLVLVAFLTQPGVAQTDSLSDVLPLAIGNQWTYNFYTFHSYNFIGRSQYLDTGVVSYDVVGRIPSSDSTLWQLFQRRTYTHTYSSNDPPILVSDSGSFGIVEFHTGHHELYTVQGTAYAVLTIPKATADSQMVFRYALTDSLGNALQRTSFPTVPFFQCPPAIRNYSLKNAMGITRLLGEARNCYDVFTTRYYLSEFQPSYPDPHLSVPYPEITIRTLFGRINDTTVTIQNRGLQPVQISNVISSNPKFGILGWSQLIPPLSNGSVSIRYNPSRAESIQTAVVITSNSTTSPDTIVVRGESKAGAVLSLSDRIVDFSTVPPGSVNTISRTMANNGNIPLLIDSTRGLRNRREFSVGRISNRIDPQESVQVEFTFTAPSSSPPGLPVDMWDILFLFSNSLAPVDSFILWARYVPRPNVSISSPIVDFGLVELGSHKQMIVTITNLMDFGMNYVKTGPQQSCFQSSIVHNSWVFENHETLRDTITFAPTSRGVILDTIIYRFMVVFTEARTDTIFLRGEVPPALPTHFSLAQNYPNPFNPSTNIEFQIPRPELVLLKMYNLLGQEVRTLVNEPRGVGVHKVRFDAQGLPSGVYFYRLTTGSFRGTKKLILLR